MFQLSAQSTHGGQVFLLIWGVGALIMGSVIASQKGSGWFRSTIVSGLEGKPAQQARAKNFGGVRLIAAVMAGAGLVGVAAAVVLLTRG
ncbi:hypothetical protein [Streptomyces sp. NPDC003996]